ncbi:MULTISPECIES: hypothetical protein [Microbacterium]|uniref:hypothetical protein n=1 Tax=Microbacterium TaxID=33882 RepID=UPI0025EB086C|nr:MULTISPECIES: hypothetical protein [Microbacterium]
MSENGDYLAWDTGARDDDGELPIFHTSRFNSLTRIGDDLYEAIEWLRCRFPLEMADNPRDSTLVGGGPGLRIPREMADSYTAL